MKLSYLGLVIYVLAMFCFAIYIWFIWPPAAIILLVVTGLMVIYSIRLLSLTKVVSQMYPQLIEAVQHPEPIYHPNGIPVGMLPGDPVPEQNLAAIFDFVERHGQPVAQAMQPGETVQVQLEVQEGQQGG